MSAGWLRAGSNALLLFWLDECVVVGDELLAAAVLERRIILFFAGVKVSSPAHIALLMNGPV